MITDRFPPETGTPVRTPRRPLAACHAGPDVADRGVGVADATSTVALVDTR